MIVRYGKSGHGFGARFWWCVHLCATKKGMKTGKKKERELYVLYSGGGVVRYAHVSSEMVVYHIISFLFLSKIMFEYIQRVDRVNKKIAEFVNWRVVRAVQQLIQFQASGSSIQSVGVNQRMKASVRPKTSRMQLV